jgi:hypothetical protein
MVIIDCDADDLGMVEAPIGSAVEPALRRLSPYAMMRARASTRASMAAAATEGAQVADLPTGRIDLTPPPRFDPLMSIDPH